MGPLPKRKISQGRRNRRRAHDALTPPSLAPCDNCGVPIPHHQVCPECGYYRGQPIVEIKEKES